MSAVERGKRLVGIAEHCARNHGTDFDYDLRDVLEDVDSVNFWVYVLTDGYEDEVDPTGVNGVTVGTATDLLEEASGRLEDFVSDCEVSDCYERAVRP